MLTILRPLSLAVAALLVCAPARADVVRLVVEQRQPFTNKALPYEKLTGHVYGELDPRIPLNAVITDIELAPRNARGKVEYSATFTILKPVDIPAGTGIETAARRHFRDSRTHSMCVSRQGSIRRISTS